LNDLRKNTSYYYLVFLLLLCLPGLFSSDDYGIAWDEPQQRLLGKNCYNYIFNDSDEYLEFKDKHYGVAFELPLTIIEKNFFNPDDQQSIYRTRHLLSHLFFIFSVCIFFLLLKRVFGRNWLALLGALMLLLSPRIFAHSFFNSKDIPFMSMMIIAVYTMILSGNKKYSLIALHAVITGLLINIRILGVLMIGLTLLFYFLESLNDRKWKVFLSKSFVFTITVLLVLYLSWPYLWENPVVNFLESFKVMGQFNWDDPVLFFGNHIPAWISVSVPAGYLITIVTGVILFIIWIFQNPGAIMKDSVNKIVFVSLVGAILPVIAVIFRNSTLYDDWRQMYFIYPFLLIIAMYGINRINHLLKEQHVLASILFVAFTIYLGVTGIKMINLHPYQQVYFNELIPKKEGNIRESFEMDYWGLSYFEALNNILEIDDSDTLNIAVANIPGKFNVLLLYKNDSERINYVDAIEDADYFISNYRFHKDDYQWGEPKYNIIRNNSRISSTWRFTE